MAGILEIATSSGNTLYAHIRNSSGSIWDGSSFVSYNSLNWANYDIAMTEETSSGYYKVTIPAGINTAQVLTAIIYFQNGGSPALGDVVMAARTFEWNGSSIEVGPETALVNVNLDHMASVASGIPNPTIGTYVDKIMNKNSGQTFDQSTDSLEAIRDAGSGGPTASQIADAVWDEVLDSSHVTADSGAERLKAIDDKLPSGTISDFDQAIDNVNLNADQSGVTIGTVNNLGTNAKGHVNAEVADVLYTDTISELLSGAPSATPTIANAVMLLYMALRDKRTASTDEVKIYNNAGSVICKAAVSDNGVQFTKEQFGAP